MRSLLLSLGVLLAALSARAINTIEPVSGEIRGLKGEAGLRIEFAYADDLRVGEMAEADYVKKKRDEYNAKTPGRGDALAEEWVTVRTNRCQPSFERGANEALKKAKVPLRLSAEATGTKYTMRILVRGLDPGWSGTFVGQSATVTGDVLITETTDPQKVLCQLKLDRMVGLTTKDGLSHHIPDRLADAFHGCGRTLAKFLVKNGLK